MCYYKSISKDKVYLEKRFQAKFESPTLFKEAFYLNGFSKPKVPVILNGSPETISMVNWGLIPRWVKDKNQANDISLRTLNAKAETVFELPSYRAPIISNRCLVLVDGFFEWREYKKKKYPYFISLKNQEAFALAGIWDSWVDKSTGEELITYSVITCPANSLMEKIHNTKMRMPVILNPDTEKNWLEPNLSKEAIHHFLTPYNAAAMEAYSISKLITSRTENPDQPEVIKPFQYPELNGIQIEKI